MASSGRGHRDGVEITAIGVLYQGPLEKKYWSSSRGKEKYPYPIGYKATRWHGGHCYFMEVIEGVRGPSFVVKCEEGITCSGQTPSVAWEDILKKKHAGAKRVVIRSACTSIDGAEMFGFTNPLVQRLCRDLVVSASGATENSNSLPDDEVKECMEDAAKGAPREAGSFPESSGKSPVKARRGNKLIQSPKIKGEDAEEKQKNEKQRATSQLIEEEQETKETRKQKLKRPARESSETSQDVKVMERTQINTPRKDNAVAQHSHREEEEMPRCKRSKLPKAKVGPYSEEDTEHVGGSQNVSSANSKGLKSVPLGTKRIKDEDRPEGQTSKDAGHVTSPHGLSGGNTQNQTLIPLLKDTEESSAVDCSSEVPMSHFTASGPSRTASASDRTTANESSQRTASSRKKRMKLAKPQKIPPIVKPEKYDTEVDLTQSEGFLSIDLMCPSAEDMEKEILGGSALQKYGNVSSKQDGYLMLLAACKVAEVEQVKEKTVVADIKRKRPISDVDYPKAEKTAPEAVCFPSSSKGLLSRAGHTVGVNELASFCSDTLLGDESPQILVPPGERVDTDSAPEKVYSSDIKVSLQKTTHEDELLSGQQSKEDGVSHNDPGKMDVGDGKGEKVPFKSNFEVQTEKYSDKSFGRKENKNGSSQMKSEEVPALHMSLHEQVSKSLESTMPGVQQKDATQEDGCFKVSVVKREQESSPAIENWVNVTSQSVKLSTELTDSSVAYTVVSSDARPLTENATESASNFLNNIDPRQVDPLGAIPTAHKGTSSPQTLESGEVLENIDSKQSKVCSVEISVPGTTCDIQLVHRSACASVADIAVTEEDIACLELQGSRSLTTDAYEEQETSVPDTAISQFGSRGTTQPVLSVQTVEGSATAMKIGCSEMACEEPRSAVLEENRIETGIDNSQGWDENRASTVLDNNHHVGMDMPVDSESCRNLSSASEREECLPKSLKQPLKILTASVKAAPTVCFDAGLTKLEKESKNSEDKNDTVNGMSPESHANLQRDFVAEDLVTSTPHAGNTHVIDFGAQSKALLTRTSEMGMESSPVLVDRVEFDLRVSADRSTSNITEKLLPAVVGAVRGTESGLEMRLGNCNEICANTVFNLDQSVDLTAGTSSRKETQMQLLDVGGCKSAIDHLEIKRENSSSGNEDVEMVCSATPIDRMESDIKGSSGSEEDKIEDHVPTTVEGVKDSESGGRFQLSGNGVATVLTSKESVDVPRDIIHAEQTFDSKGPMEVADRIKKHIDITKSPVDQIAEAKMVSSDYLGEESDMDLANRGAESVMERFTPALIMAVKDTVKSAELALPKANELDTLKVISSTDPPSEKYQGPQVFDVEGGVSIAESPALLPDQPGCAPSDWRGTSEEREPRAIVEGKLPVQGDTSNPTLAPEYFGEKTRSSQLVDPVNLSELQEIKHPAFISQREESTGCVTTLVTEQSLGEGVLGEKHIQVDGCTASDQPMAMMEAESPLPLKVQNRQLSENPSQKSESDSAGRELTSSMMTLLLPQAMPFLPTSKKVEKKEKPVMCEDIPSKTGDIDVGTFVSLIGSGPHPSELPVEAGISPTTLDAAEARGGDSLSCKASTTVGIVQQLRSLNDPVLNREGVDTDCGSSVQASDSGSPMEIDLEVNAGNQLLSCDSNQEQRVSIEVSNSQEGVAGEICVRLGGRTPSEVHANTTYAVTTAEKGNKSKHPNKELASSETLPKFAWDDCEISQPVLSSGAIGLDVCEDSLNASPLYGTEDVANEHASSCLSSHIISLNPSDTQDSVGGPCRMTSSDASSLEGAPQVQQEAQVCTKFVHLDLACPKTDMKIESAHQQLAGYNESDKTASERLDNQKSEPVVSSQTDLGVGLKMSTDIMVQDEVSLVEHPEPEMLTRSNCQIQDFEKKEGVYLEEIQGSGDPVLVDTAPAPNLPARKPESTSRGSQDAQSKLLPSGASCDNPDHSQSTTWPLAPTNLSEKVKQANLEATICPEPSLSSVQRDESGEIQSSYFQKMELPISIEHPTTVSTMVINVRGNEIRLCVCCGTGSERTLSVFRILYTEGAHLEHQLLTVLETTYKNRYYEDGKIKLASDESGLRFTPDGQQLILLDSFEVRDSRTPDTRDGHGLTIISLEGCDSSTRIESEGALLSLAVREPQRLIAAGEDGVINFWDMDPSWRSFEKKISLPKATLDGVTLTSVTSLLVVPHFQHMVVGCNPSGFFALWDMDRGTLLYSCQMFDDLLLKTSLVDTKSMNWEQPIFSDTPHKTECREALQPLSTLPFICLLTMVTRKERFILESKENVISFNEQEPQANDEGLTTPKVIPRDTNAALLNSHDGSSKINERTPQEDAVDTSNCKDSEHEEQNSGDKVKESTITSSSNSDQREQRKIPGPWDCKTVLMQGDRIVCGHALSDRPTSITSLGRYGVMGTADGLVHLWDVENGRKLLQLDDLKGSAVVSLATSSSLAVLATAGENKRVNLYLQKEIFAEDIKKNS